MLVGCLIGLSHVDPLAYGLSLDRFLSADTSVLPDIDLDFPRDLWERLIRRVIAEWGWDHAALTGMFPTYRVRGALRNLGKALGLPAAETAALARRAESGRVAELDELPGFADKARRPGWRDLFPLWRNSWRGFPRGLAQHPVAGQGFAGRHGVSPGVGAASRNLTFIRPVEEGFPGGWRSIPGYDAQRGATYRFDAGAAGGYRRPLYRPVGQGSGGGCRVAENRPADYRDPEAFADLGRGNTVGVFQGESAAQQQTIVRMRPQDIYALALEGAAVRPGVGRTTAWPSFCAGGPGRPGIMTIPGKGRLWSVP